MSRIGRRKINIPQGVEVKEDKDSLKIKGKLGELDIKLHNHVKVAVKDGSINVSVKDPENKEDRALWGLHNALISNMIEGVENGFEKELEIIGVGYKAELQNKKLILQLGFSHPVEMEIPAGLEVAAEKEILKISGIDKQKVGAFAAKIRSLRKPEPYKGKGIRYKDEHVRRKAGKQAKAEEGGG